MRNDLPVKVLAEIATNTTPYLPAKIVVLTGGVASDADSNVWMLRFQLLVKDPVLLPHRAVGHNPANDRTTAAASNHLEVGITFVQIVQYLNLIWGGTRLPRRQMATRPATYNAIH